MMEVVDSIGESCCERLSSAEMSLGAAGEGACATAAVTRDWGRAEGMGYGLREKELGARRWGRYSDLRGVNAISLPGCKVI
jgi:hypothetical protein